MKKTLFLILAFLFLSVSASFAAEKNIEILLDVSASMKDPIEGRAKIDIAKEAVTTVLSEIPDDMPVGMRVYGASYNPEYTDEQNCRASKLLVPVSLNGKAAISANVGTLSPLGLTPIDYSLRQAAQDFPDKSAQCFIVLVSDGKETCGGDPVAAAKSLKAQGYNIVVHTVGFDVDEATRAQLKAIADAAGGMYLDARNASGLGQSLTVITQKIRENVVYQEEGEAAPGKGFSNASAVKLGESYSHDILVGEEHFYKVKVKKGEEISLAVTMKRKEAGPGWDGAAATAYRPEGKDKNYGNPASFSFTVSLFDTDRVLLSGGKPLYVLGDQINPETTRITAKMPFSGEAFISIGLGWKYDAKPKMAFSETGMAGLKGEDSWQELFDQARHKTDPTAYYTFTVRKAE